MTAQQLVAEQSFGTVSDLIRLHAREQPSRPALADAHGRLDYAALDARMDRVAAALQRDGLGVGDAIAVCANASVDYVCVFLGALRAGVAVAPLAPGSAPDSLARMVRDADARLVFVDAVGNAAMGDAGESAAPRIALQGEVAGARPLADWLAPEGATPQPAEVQPATPFNIIYSSGTTGEPKGIVQGHGMRWAHIQRGAVYGYGPESVTLLSTPLYSNTTLVVFFPTLAFGGCVWLMPKFDAGQYLQLAEREGVTHTMLVPVQYQRLMAHPDFDRHDLSRFQAKFCTSAPFRAELKADVLARWPGGLIEFYGMTEGGGTCILEAHAHPDKLHTVGCVAPGSDIRLIDDEGREVPAGEAGEVVGHSAGMMVGYHKQPAKTREAEWFAPDGKRFIRTGDVGRFDADGFLTLFDRKKDMVISGGFNLYPSDLEAVLRRHPAVADCSVIGIPSEQWGETPVAYVVHRPGDTTAPETIREWANEQLGKTQRLAGLRFIDELPRSAIGKVLKRELRERWAAAPSN
ncbi:acyl-CoA synthetase (AMP-forming)/AMP-acid ligase II [Pseudacidovorax sp. 1753]|uniref:class I adenylate-forming enzyme family protein n=1 Tax=Pseudacidovorax sp. 1753 TaxID=3156419 RepID=UPI00339511FC